MPTELWTSSLALPGLAEDTARRLEAEGWDGVTFTDSPQYAGDPFVAMAMAIPATSSLQMATGVTNPVTRFPAIVASAIGCLHQESGGRISLGLGRGDGALAFLGLSPAPVPALERFLLAVRAYLRGESVEFDAAGQVDRSVSGLPLGSAPVTSRVSWLADLVDLPPAPVFVAASGPKVIRLAAEHADRLTLAVGADPVRVAWGITEGRQRRAGVAVGAWINVVVDEDVARARRAASTAVVGFARMSAMHGTATGPVTESQRAVFERIPMAYKMASHFQAGTQEGLPDDFVDRYAVVGPPSYCVERLVELAELGVDRFHIINFSGFRPEDRAVDRAATTRFAGQVMEPLRAATKGL